MINFDNLKCRCGGKGRIFRYCGAYWSVECCECGLQVEGDTMKEACENWERECKCERAGDQ